MTLDPTVMKQPYLLYQERHQKYRTNQTEYNKVVTESKVVNPIERDMINETAFVLVLDFLGHLLSLGA